MIACDLCIDGYCSDPRCRGGRQCQAAFCFPPLPSTEGTGGEGSAEEAKANAALLVEAVNAFDPGREEHIRELIAAARSVREVLLVALREACELSDFGAEKHRAIMQLDRALAHFEEGER